MRILCLLLCVGAVSEAGLADSRLVRAEPFLQLQIDIVRSAPAEVVSRNESRLSAEITARVARIHAQVGEVVARDALLIELDCRDYRLRLRQAEAETTTARARQSLADQQLRRAQALAQEQHVSAELLDQRQSELTAGKSTTAARRVEVEAARLNVERCTIKSPFRAVVKAREAGLGELARPGTPLITLQDLEQPEVTADIVPAESGELAAARELELEYLGNKYPLRLLRVAPAVDTTTRTQEARLGFSAGGAPVGASGRLRWTAPRPGVPASLVVRRGERLGVFLVSDGRAAFRHLPDALEGRPAAVELAPDSLLITEGRHAVNDGDPLELAE